MPNHYYPAVGICIYCGETELPPGVCRFGDEHIIPFSMGGSLILREASCKRCERLINGQIETPVISQEWGDLRTKRKFPTRNKSRKEKKTHVRVRAVDGSLMRVPLADHSTPVLMYKFSEARILSGLPQLLDDMSWSAALLASHDEEEAMQRKYARWDKTHRIVARPYPFARMLAKIAYGYAVAEYGMSKLGAFKPLVNDIILGQSDDYFYTVGGSWEIHPAVPGGDHTMDIGVRFVAHDRGLLIIDIRLFSQIETPKYHVVVGEISLKNPEHVAVFEKHRRDDMG